MDQKSRIGFVLLLLLVSFLEVTLGQDEVQIWDEFINTLKTGNMTVDRIRPHEQLGDKYKPIILGYLDSIRINASLDDWNQKPEIIRVENRIQYILPWTSRNHKTTFCFSILLEGSNWYFQHLEAIFIRLDKISNLPTSEFPDISKEMKNWVRAEFYWSDIVQKFYLPIAKEKGKQHALNMLKDGAGYFVAAKTWVPFSPPQKAFILFLCWEQAKLRGNEVTLIKLKENEAHVRLDTHFFALYFTAAHLKTRISIEDYKQIFETIWQDRSVNAGWRLEIQYLTDYQVEFHFTKN